MTTAPNAKGACVPPTAHWDASTLVWIRAKIEMIYLRSNLGSHNTSIFSFYVNPKDCGFSMKKKKTQHGKLTRFPAAV